MSNLFKHRLGRFDDAGSELLPLFLSPTVGLEREALRVAKDGVIAQSAHPPEWGSALTHPFITTDYSEALAEFITPPLLGAPAAQNNLAQILRFTNQHLPDGEYLWSASMPCMLASDDLIPIAQYGSSNLGMMKTVYRRGLGLRYGRAMQTIAGIHFNFSFNDNLWPVLQHWDGAEDVPLQTYINQRYFGVLRNLQRFGWLIPYLFGASPAVCKTFLGGRETLLQDWDEHSYYEPMATSLRMGDIGYTNSKESGKGIKANYTSVEDYIHSLHAVITKQCPEYRALGVARDGVYQQLNANLLQIENEYYSSVRPKQPPQGNEMPIVALRRRGVRYIELRSLDVNPFEPCGVTQAQMQFLELFMLYCLFQDSPTFSSETQQEIDHNFIHCAETGRDAKLQLQRDGSSIGLRDWALEMLDEMQVFAEALDVDASAYVETLSAQRAKVLDAGLTPSARVLQEMRDKQCSFFTLAREYSLQHREYWRSKPLTWEQREHFKDLALMSHTKQRALEAEAQIPFSAFLQNYFEQAQHFSG